MPNQYPSEEVKLAIVKEAWAGHKIAQIARKYQVCRDSIYTWMHMATQACLQAFGPQKRGPKFKKLADKDQLIASLKNQITQFEYELKIISQNSHVQLSSKYAKLLRPDRCPYCGHSRILLNGAYSVKTDDGSLTKIPRFICKQCHKRVYL
jgi:transposase-like protein